ncbi:hypothetical protein [Nostoc punctiforme]|uniref:Uncharacterized protein n=1 Tax=Nostoc punctiforme (strain ATCC 29133 / PCC 73102) TaxID=63737 RepID=B2J0W8_NOSP7|nr:hypothetical protein [Nostoc punctiforme]ACC81819.1 hypothetical protein Npun_F3403 [Nostoc punctiforme PCC 73102]
MNNVSKDLEALEEIFIAIEVPDLNDVVILQGSAIVDLAEFQLTPQETMKFKKIFEKVNTKLAESLYEQFPASSIISEIRVKSQ